MVLARRFGVDENVQETIEAVRFAATELNELLLQLFTQLKERADGQLATDLSESASMAP